MAENLPTRPRSAPRRGPNDRAPSAPKHLSAEAKRIWRSIVAEWVLGPEALPLLRAGLESWDLYQACRAELRKAGPTIVSPRSGMVRQHPSVKTGNDALTQFRQCFRQLGLEPPEA